MMKTSCLFDEGSPLPVALHPDTLFDSPYQNVPLDPTPYRAWPGDLRPGTATANAVDLVGTAGRLRVEVCAPWLLRLRWVPGTSLGPSVTEQLGLLRVPAVGGPWSQQRGAGEFAVRADELEFALEEANNNWCVRGPQKQLLLECLSGTETDEPLRRLHKILWPWGPARQP